MPNPIQGLNTASPVAPASTGQTGSAGGADGGSTSPTTAAVDSADVATMQSLLQQISAAADQVPTIDQAKVLELQQAIASGSYQANPQEIAQKLLQLEGVLAGPGGSQ